MRSRATWFKQSRITEVSFVASTPATETSGGLQAFPVVVSAGEAFDLGLLTSSAIANIICSMVYGCRFDYGHQEFSHLVDSTRRRTELMFSPSVQVWFPLSHIELLFKNAVIFHWDINILQMYNDFPWLFKWVKNRKEFHKLSAISKKRNWDMCTSLKDSLDPQKCRCLADAFMVHQQNLEVKK